MIHADADWLSATEAAALLGVRRETLYAYVSRGLVRAQRAAGVRVYARVDLQHLHERSQARRGHTAVAASALYFGEPVLETRVSDVGPTGPRYRGQSAIELARSGVSVERVAELLWTGTLPAREPAWPRVAPKALECSARAVDAGTSPLSCMQLALSSLPFESTAAWEAPFDVEVQRARHLLGLLVAAIALRKGSAALRRTLAAPNLPSAILRSFGGASAAPAENAVRQALVLVADHELNASTFTARIAAGAGADLPRCLLAAMATLSGGRHGGTCERLERVLDGFAVPEQALGWVRGELTARRALPGFGHPLYPAGDPRAPLLLDSAAELAPKNRHVRAIQVACEAMALAGAEPPTLDLGLVAVARALGLAPGAATAIFAVGRALGHVVHVFEQREQGRLLRPRALYVGA